MADTGLTFWAPGFWADDFWAAGFWSGGEAPPVVVTDQTTGGGHAFYNDYELERTRSAKRRREREKRKQEAEQIPEDTSREIAKLLHEQEAKDEERADLQRIQAMADRYVGSGLNAAGVPRNISAVIQKAYEERTRNALEQMRREIERLFEEEELAVIAALLMDD